MRQCLFHVSDRYHFPRRVHQSIDLYFDPLGQKLVADARLRLVSATLATVKQDRAVPLEQQWCPPNAQPKAFLSQTVEIEARFITTLPSVVPSFRRVLRYQPGYRRPVAE